MLDNRYQSQLQSTQYYSYPAVTRYFDHIQSRPSVRKSAETLAPAFSLVQFDLENAPRIERKADPPKEKKKAAKGNATPADRSGTATPVEAPVAEKNKVAESSKPATADAENAGAKAQKKEKKEKKATAESGSSKKAAAPKAAAEDAGDPVPSMVDLRVGHIVNSEYFLLALSPPVSPLYSRKTSRCGWPLC